MAIKCSKCNTENPETLKFCGECGTQLSSPKGIETSVTRTLETTPDELARGSLFADRYEIIEELGRGGMGSIYRVEDKKLNQDVALKLIKPEIASDARTIERFRNELKTARMIAHKNVCRMFDLGEAGRAHFITMEYVRGEDLKSMIRMSGQLGIGTAINIAKQICDGLSEAHKLGVVHRDLKPSNIMVDKDGNVHIMDFGIARSLESKGMTGAGVMIGTPEYMSPEQVEGKEADQHSDIYSLGVILYEMVTGRVPFGGETPFSIALKHKSEAPKDPKEFNAQLSDDLSRVILRCLEKDKEKRYQSAGELRSELARIEEGVPRTERIVAKPKPTAGKQITVTFGLKKVLIPAAAVVAVVIIGIILWKAMHPKGPVAPPKNPLLVVLPFENLGSAEDEYFADGITDEITNRLSSLHGLDVIARASAIQYKKTNKTITQIKNELNVDYILQGTIRWDEGLGDKRKIRINPQLIRTSDGTQIWSEIYDRAIEDIFKTQSELAEQVTEQLDLTLLEPERQKLSEHLTENLEAYTYFLKGWELYSIAAERYDLQSYLKAIQMFVRAVELDAKFTAAYMGLFNIHSRLYLQGMDRTDERLAKAKAALDKAMELEPDSPEAQLCLALYYYRIFLDYDRALKILENIQKIRPGLAWSYLSYIQRRQGKWDESVKSGENGFRLNPRSADGAFQQAITYISLRKYEMANLFLERCLANNPDFVLARLNKANNILLWKGDIQGAKEAMSGVPPNPWVFSLRAYYCLLERDYKGAAQNLEFIPFDTREEQDNYFNKDLFYAWIYFVQKDLGKMKTHAERARENIEMKLKERPEDPRYHAALGIALAFLGRKEEAISEGKRAAEIYPVSKDHLSGPVYIANLACIYSLCGDSEGAIGQLEYLLSNPCGGATGTFWAPTEVPVMRIDPTWDPIRQNPRFEQLLKKYSTD